MVPTNDYVFKRLFGHVGNEKITAGLISSIIKEKIETIKINENPITQKDMKDDKVGILDLKAKLNNEIICNVEMQVVQQKDIDRRIMFYWSKTYIEEIKEKQKYSVLPKTIVILIANFELYNLKEIPKFHTKWQIREEEYRKIILTDTLEVHIIELPKLINQLSKNSRNDKNSSSFLENVGDEDMNEKGNEEKLKLWLKFLLNPDSISEEDLIKNEDIRLAKEELEKIKLDEHERYMAELRMKHIRDSQAIEDYGFDRGLEQGLEQGLQRGSKNKQIEITKKLLAISMPIEQIIEITGLTEEEIKNIQ